MDLINKKKNYNSYTWTCYLRFTNLCTCNSSFFIYVLYAVKYIYIYYYGLHNWITNWTNDPLINSFGHIVVRFGFNNIVRIERPGLDIGLLSKVIPTEMWENISWAKLDWNWSKVMLDQKHGQTADRNNMRQVVRSKNMKLKKHTNKNANPAQVHEDLKSKNYTNL